MIPNQGKLTNDNHFTNEDLKVKYNCVILEDDYSAAVDLRVKLSEIGCEVKETIIYPEDKITSSKFNGVDFIISDVKLGKDVYAFDLLKDIKKLPPLIFVSSYSDDELYQESSKLNPYIYLTKPLSSVCLKSAIQGVLRNVRKRRNNELEIVGSSVFIRSRGQLISINPYEIKYLYSEGNYCFIYTSDDKKRVIRSSLKNIIEKMNYNGLIQVHRSYVINKRFVKNLIISENSISMDNINIPIGGAYKKSAIDFILKTN